MPIKLRPMTPDEYAPWYDETLNEYAQEHVAAGHWTAAEALERSRQEFGALLPQGLATPRQHLYTIADPKSGEALGMIWLAERRDGPEPPHAFIYNIALAPEHRGKGYGKAAMLAVEGEVRALGLRRIGLHVFGANEPAIRLYERTGYRATNVLMAKDLD